MTLQENHKLTIDGSSFADLEIGDIVPSQCKGYWDFLTRVVPGNPWIAGLAAIVGVVWLGAIGWVQAVAIVGITIITVASTLEWRLHGRSKATNEFDHVREDPITDRSSKGGFGQRLSVGSDPPIGGASGNTV